MKRQYDLNGCKVDVLFLPELVRIDGTEQLLTFLNTDLNNHTLRLVKLIKLDYRTLMGKPLKISNSSMMIEIWAHLYASKFAIALSELIKFCIIQNITEIVSNRSEIIDCGEIGIDSNREFWDALAKFKTVIIKFL